MKKRLVRYSLIAGMALALAVPTLAYSRGPRAGEALGAQAGRPRAGAPQREPRRGNRAARPPRNGNRLTALVLTHADRIGMSEQQRDDILAQERERREESINRRALTQIEMLELRDLMTAGPRDLGAIEAKLRELSERRVDAEMAALRREEAMRGILSAEQVEALREIAQEARSDRPRDGRRGRARRR